MNDFTKFVNSIFLNRPPHLFLGLIGVWLRESRVQILNNFSPSLIFPFSSPLSPPFLLPPLFSPHQSGKLTQFFSQLRLESEPGVFIIIFLKSNQEIFQNVAFLLQVIFHKNSNNFLSKSVILIHLGKIQLLVLSYFSRMNSQQKS